jgi:outer membrane beta-barrel protein
MIKHILLTLMISVITIASSTIFSSPAFAQIATGDLGEAGDSSEENAEELFSSEPAVTPPQDNTASSQVERSEESVPSKSKNDVTDLSRIEPLTDIAVIQRRFLPKTGRFEFFAAGTMILNDAFFLNIGAGARLAYYFRERYGVEFIGTYLSVSERQVTSDLFSKYGVQTTSFITPKSYLGADFRWVPVYGKMTLLNRKITPFDLYFSLGAGMTSTNTGASEPTLHAGAGQVFAISKSMAFRWDFSWNTFAAASAVAGGSERSVYNNLFLTMGMSFFFPEATYR